MRYRLTIIALLLLAGIAIVLVCPLASGGADPGIKKEHLDPDAGVFVDDVTIEIGDNGLQVKAIPNASVLPAKVDSIFGAWTDDDSGSSTLAKDNVYKATSDGFILAYGTMSSNGNIKAYTDGSNPPLTQRASGYAENSKEGGLMVPVRKEDYVKITIAGTSATIYWLPIGSSGSLEKQE
jgi:hypothetical protein